jgi:translation initiation factor IF-1
VICEDGLEKSEIANRRSQLIAVVRSQLPSGLYDVEIDRGQRVTAHLAGGLERNFVRVLVGDRVVVELMPRDLTRGRIVRKA